MDCMELMKEFPDKYFDLAIVDPPYGIKGLKKNHGHLSKYGDISKANNAVPNKQYFSELFRVSKNQIIWGGNYFAMPKCRCFVCWFKHQPLNNYSDCEYAWTSFEKPAKVFDYPYFGSINAEPNRIHPTQKPVALYRWLLKKYAQEGDIILDTHVGSASSLIACYQMGFTYVGSELDKEFFDKATERLENEKSQIRFEDLEAI